MGIRLPFLTEDNGIVHEWEDMQDGKIIVHSYQDVDPILERNLALRNENDGYNRARDMRRIASIPEIVLMQWLAERGGTMHELMLDDKFISKKLNDIDWSKLKTSPYKVV